ncbi:hypothetical protein AGABI1DRAFT_135211 [Agaricus bisporus var. burnettii JB137-S8]|uniref:Uncharacterized protein n=1 Tax=Agaricus bisporus var. burnettii (strain JB137-S8 / ATCC MYA-4627 / FGSC 10392) TaxID=597362 RepID=K5WR83_AGABU|nr:uncharacterized protein AGABI1DRAFT_135211 [Agaricus bisporus var. burnettii JB137-S8]EKM73258.1 hypothetical protein AGABI1DRAFT_135211 [Agaricus bisporus var. burnettii JB137-S8]
MIAKCQVAIKHDPEISPHVFGDARRLTSEGGHAQIDARSEVLENGSHLGIRLF